MHLRLDLKPIILFLFQYLMWINTPIFHLLLLFYYWCYLGNYLINWLISEQDQFYTSQNQMYFQTQSNIKYLSQLNQKSLFPSNQTSQNIFLDKIDEKGLIWDMPLPRIFEYKLWSFPFEYSSSSQNIFINYIWLKWIN